MAVNQSSVKSNWQGIQEQVKSKSESGRFLRGAAFIFIIGQKQKEGLWAVKSDFQNQPISVQRKEREGRI